MRRAIQSGVASIFYVALQPRRDKLAFTVTAQSPSIDAYRTGARRLRCRYHNNAAMKLLALRTLSAAHDHAERTRAMPTRNGAPDRLREFTDRVTCELLTGSPLRYSRRLALLNRARGLGINRFDANLMIAAVQNRAPQRSSPAPAQRPRLMLPLFAFVVIQSLIVAGAWLAFAR
jgi:hypothetical protein